MGRQAARLQSLDSLRLITRGSPLKFSNLVYYQAPSINQFGVFSKNESGNPVAVHMVQEVEANYAQLLYLIADGETDQDVVYTLLESVIRASGEWGVHFLAGDLLSDSPLLPIFRRLDFILWARQVICRLALPLPSAAGEMYHWRVWNNQDIRAMVSVYHSLVPDLFQAVEPLTRKAMLGLVLYDQDHSILGYADLVYGPHGIWVQPFLLPQARDPQIVIDLVHALPSTFGRPIYFSLRSYQPWLKELFVDEHFSMGPEKALLVKYLVVKNLALGTLETFAERSRVQTGIPFARFEEKR